MEQTSSRGNRAFVLGILFCCLALAEAASANQIASSPLPMMSYAFLVGDEPSGSARSQDDAKEDDGLDFLETDLERLSRVRVHAPTMDIQVTSVSKQTSTVGRSPAAVFVITQEMIRRSGSTCIPELLRMAPGVNVSKISSHA